MGILLLVLDINAYVRQRLTDGLGLCLGGFSMFLVLAGIIAGIFKEKPDAVLVIVMLFICFLLLIIFLLCTAVSVLVMKNRELAMQVSLLNQENERIIHELGIMPVREENGK